MVLSDGQATVVNSTICNNHAAEYGGGLLVQGSTIVKVENCIIWGNTPEQIYVDEGTAPAVAYSDVQGGCPGPGNIDADPLFVEPAAGDFHLAVGSPCVDAGSNLAVPEWLTSDLDGQPRRADDPLTADSGAGAPPIVDIGCDELQPCVGDLDGDRTVGLSDLSILLANYGTPSGAGYEDGDLDLDGDVDLSDLAILLGAYGTICD